MQITLSGAPALPSSPTNIKTEVQFGSPTPDAEVVQPPTRTAPKPTCDASELVEMMEASDGEIMDGEENMETIKMNKIQQVAETTLRNQNRSKSKSRRPSSRASKQNSTLQSPSKTLIKQNPEDDNLNEESKTADQDASKNIDKLPHDMLCVICFAARKTIMI